MKTIDLSNRTADIESILDQAEQEELIVRAPDGREFLLVAVNDFDHEIVRTRANERLMQFLDDRAQRVEDAVPLEDAKRQLGL